MAVIKAAVYDHPGGPEVFRYQEVPDPPLTADGVLVAVEAISVEGGDTLHRAGGEVPSAPHIVGYQAAGTVLAAGDQARGFTPGDRVVTVGTDGSHAELRVVPERFCWHIPPGLPTEVAACVPIAFGTADDALFEFGRLQPGETVLIHAGASGVGIAAIQLASRAGARVPAGQPGPHRLLPRRRTVLRRPRPSGHRRPAGRRRGRDAARGHRPHLPARRRRRRPCLHREPAGVRPRPAQAVTPK